MGVDANADYESAAGSGDERRPALEEKTVQRAGVSAVREMMDWPVA
jgi:membrane protein required for beta-lactamase induction